VHELEHGPDGLPFEIEKVDLHEPTPRAPDNSDLEFVGKILE
jgi:hypothetical protein